jgi:APA family basic amino acid/polyamine antiporter
MSSGTGALEAIEPPSPQKHPLLLICAALLPAFFAYGGWQHALWMAGEIRQPKRNVPLAIVGGVLIVVTVYLLANWAYLHLLGYQGVVESETLAADAVASVWPRIGGRLAGVAVAISAFGVLNAQLLSGPRLIHEMAKDGRFFSAFAGVSRRFNTPLTSIVLLGVLALTLLFATRHDPVMMLVSNVVFLDAIFFALTGIALIVLRRKQRDTAKQFRFPGRLVVPLLFVTGELSILAGAMVHRNQRIAALIGVGWIAVGAVLYWLLCSGRGGSTD